MGLAQVDLKDPVLDDFLTHNRDGLIARTRDTANTHRSPADPAKPQNGNDVTLLQRVATGDHRAAGELYDVHSGLLFGLLVRMLGQRTEAEEVLQEVFVQARTVAHTYDASMGTPGGWLCGIARKLAIDRLRARTGEEMIAALPPESPEAVLNPEVHAALQSLPPDQRDLIERAYFTGATQSQMATDLGLPLETVKTRVRVGLQTLRIAVQARAPHF